MIKVKEPYHIHIHKMPSLMFVSQTLLDEFSIQMLILKEF